MQSTARQAIFYNELTIVFDIILYQKTNFVAALLTFQQETFNEFNNNNNKNCTALGQSLERFILILNFFSCILAPHFLLRIVNSLLWITQNCITKRCKSQAWKHKQVGTGQASFWWSRKRRKLHVAG